MIRFECYRDREKKCIRQREKKEKNFQTKKIQHKKNQERARETATKMTVIYIKRLQLIALITPRSEFFPWFSFEFFFHVVAVFVAFLSFWSKVEYQLRISIFFQDIFRTTLLIRSQVEWIFGFNCNVSFAIKVNLNVMACHSKQSEFERIFLFQWQFELDICFWTSTKCVFGNVAFEGVLKLLFCH